MKEVKVVLLRFCDLNPEHTINMETVTIAEGSRHSVLVPPCCGEPIIMECHGGTIDVAYEARSGDHYMVLEPRPFTW